MRAGDEHGPAGTGRACSRGTGRAGSTCAKIELQPWQRAIVMAHPGHFARGLFHSDGYRGINRVRARLGHGDQWHEYPRYLFTNESGDILRLCGETLDQLGVGTGAGSVLVPVRVVVRECTRLRPSRERSWKKRASRKVRCTMIPLIRPEARNNHVKS